MTTDLQLRRPLGIPAFLFWPAVAVAFPFVLVTSLVWLPWLVLRKASTPEPKPNTTPCGALCKLSVWHEREDDWVCLANRGMVAHRSRLIFRTKTDPNNCVMHIRKEGTEK